MDKIVDYYFFMISPFAYLGSREFERVTQEYEAHVNVKPVKVQTVFQNTGGVPPAKRAKPRQNYRLLELQRWSHVRDMTLTLQPRYFPVNDDLAAGAVYAAERLAGDPLKLAHALLAACWAEERDISDPDTVYEVARATGHDGAKLVEGAQGNQAQQAFARTTQEALDHNVFGSPWYLIDGEPFWGQDRLDFVTRKLAAT